MLVLSLDTTTRAGSSALTRDRRVLREAASEANGAPAARLPRELMALLEQEGVELGDVDVFAVATGPGSFTGLRIGIATMQGLAFATGKPLIGVSALDSLEVVGRALSGSPGKPDKACPTGGTALDALTRETRETRVATWIDAWRGEVYAALYQDGREVEPPIVALPEAVLQGLDQQPTLFVGDGAGTFRDLIVATRGAGARIADPASPLIAGIIGQLATDAARAGERPPPHAIRPLYVRRYDAARQTGSPA